MLDKYEIHSHGFENVSMFETVGLKMNSALHIVAKLPECFMILSGLAPPSGGATSREGFKDQPLC